MTCSIASRSRFGAAPAESVARVSHASSMVRSRSCMDQQWGGEPLAKAEFYRADGDRPEGAATRRWGRARAAASPAPLHRLEAVRERAAHRELLLALAQHDHRLAAPVAIDAGNRPQVHDRPAVNLPERLGV